MSLRLTKLRYDFMQRVILLNAMKLFAIANFKNLLDIYIYRTYDTKLHVEICSPDARSFSLYLKQNDYVVRVQWISNRSNNLHQRTEEILSKYCKLNATIEACINRPRVLAGGMRLETDRIFRNICTSCFTVYSPYFTTWFARQRVPHRANERVPKYTSLLSLLSFALRRTCSILAFCISCLFQTLATNGGV